MKLNPKRSTSNLIGFVQQNSQKLIKYLPKSIFLRIYIIIRFSLKLLTHNKNGMHI